jgi:very-short-patch-repair endonuclease
MHRSSRSSRSSIAAIAVERRRTPTLSERRLWERLKGSQLGVGFRREFVVGRFIVDLAAPSVRVAVEVDGGYHARIAARDACRDRGLARLGWRVLRLDSALVMTDIDAAVQRVRQALRA